jgi:hypothetical protein
LAKKLGCLTWWKMFHNSTTHTFTHHASALVPNAPKRIHLLVHSMREQ